MDFYFRSENSMSLCSLHLLLQAYCLSLNTSIVQILINRISRDGGGGRGEASVAIIRTAVESRLGTTILLGDLTLFRGILETQIDAFISENEIQCFKLSYERVTTKRYTMTGLIEIRPCYPISYNHLGAKMTSNH